MQSNFVWQSFLLLQVEPLSPESGNDMFLGSSHEWNFHKVLLSLPLDKVSPVVKFCPRASM